MEIGEHYIPQFYLKGFENSSKPSYIYVYEKGYTKILNLPISKVAKENNRWPKKIEEYFANKIEAPANPVLEKIRNRELISSSDKVTLSDYLIVLWLRVPRGFERAKEIYPDVMKKIFANTEQQIHVLIEKYPSKKEALQQRLQELPRLKLELEKELPKELWYQTLSLDNLPMVRAVIPAMTWIFITSEKGSSFLTSDNPLFFFEWQGIGKLESEITFPISSEIVLWATWRKDLKKNQYVAQREPVIREINRRIASSTTRYVYYSMEAEWVTKLVNRKSWRLNRIA
jgi:hypothetical protein